MCKMLKFSLYVSGSCIPINPKLSYWRRKHQKIGGGGGTSSRGTLGYWKGHLKNFSWKCCRRGGGGGGGVDFPIILYQNCTFLPNKKGTFDVNLVFTTTLACTKRALFITKKGTFSPLKKLGGGACAPVPPRFLRP
jgi:uncharacterized membrane protein